MEQKSKSWQVSSCSAGGWAAVVWWLLTAWPAAAAVLPSRPWGVHFRVKANWELLLFAELQNNKTKCPLSWGLAGQHDCGYTESLGEGLWSEFEGHTGVTVM